MGRPAGRSIRQKLKLGMVITGILSVILAVGGFVVYEAVTFRDLLVQDLIAKAEITGQNCTAALLFDSREDAEQTLSALASQPRVTRAAIYDQNAVLFASFLKSGVTRSFPPATGNDGYQFTAEYLELFHPIILNDNRIGTIFLETDLESLTARFVSYGTIAVLVLGGAILAAFVLATVLQKRIAMPLIALTETARNISTSRDVTIRAAKQSDDELGILADAFNEMLTQIQERDKTLVREIEERAKAEREVLVSEERYKRLFEGNPIAMWVYDLQTLSFLAVNNAATEQYGYSGGEFLSMTIKDIRPEEDIPALLQDLSKPAPAFERGQVWRHRKKNGEIIDVEISSHGLSFDGRPARLVLANNVTERRKAEKALRSSEERKDAVLQSALDGVITIDHKGLILEFNPAAETMFGHKREDALQRDMADLIIPARFRDEHRRGIRRYLETGEGPILGRRIEMTAIRADGSEFLVELSIVAVGSEQPPVFTGFVRDITERR
ncbi:MAG TPA: PAS domain S-box protein, partial [Bacteroidota bacterium]